MHKDLATLRNESEEMHAACEEEVEEEEDHQRQHCTQSKRVFVCPRQKWARSQVLELFQVLYNDDEVDFWLFFCK